MCGNGAFMRLQLLLFLLKSLSIAQAGNLYCLVGGGTRRSDISSRLEFVEDRIVPRTDGVPIPDGGLNCNWRISANYLQDPVVILSGFDTGAHLNRARMARSAPSAAPAPRMMYELHAQTATSNCSSTPTEESKPVELEMLRVVQLPRGSFLTVTVRLESSSQNTPGLRIQLMEPEFCGWDIANFNHECYMTQPTGRFLMEELAALNGDSKFMKLASFRSSSEMQSFVRESQRNRWGSGLSTRSKKPLNLTEKLRIGMFYDSRARSIFYLSHSGGDCKVEKFEDAHRLNYTVQPTNSSVSCGSLRVSSPQNGEVSGLVEFGDCSEPLSALISFADAARSRCSNCSQAVLSWLDAKEKSPADGGLFGLGAARSDSSVILVLCSAVVALIASSILIAIILIRRIRRRRVMLNESDHEQESNSLNPLSENDLREETFVSSGGPELQIHLQGTTPSPYRSAPEPSCFLKRISAGRQL